MIIMTVKSMTSLLKESKLNELHVGLYMLFYFVKRLQQGAAAAPRHAIGMTNKPDSVPFVKVVVTSLLWSRLY